jgi:hypothetical protein
MSQIESNVDILVQNSPPASFFARSIDLFKRGLILATIGGVAGAAAIAVGALWQEWALLQNDLGRVQASTPIGFQNIAPTMSFGLPPGSLVRQEGQETFLWSRWENGVGHRWFRFSRGDIEPSRLEHPETVMVSRPVDHPLVENRGGEIWNRLPPEFTVIGQELVGTRCAYPVMVLAKVQVINDVVAERPYLVVANLFSQEKEAYSIFEAELNGHRVTMAASGYFHDGKPVLYDRGTESLWIEEDGQLKAASGKHKGSSLIRVAKLAPVTWKSWLAQDPECRLLVGADRGPAVPGE